MTEQDEVLARFSANGALRAMRWSGEDAARRVRSDMPEAAGYDATSVGGARHSLLRDRMDRVFSCEKYVVREGQDPVDLDVVYQELSDDAIKTFPRIDPGTMRRSNLTGSPGWTDGTHRVLIASAEFGKMRQIRWSDRSATKQRVARQAATPGAETTVLDALPAEFLADLHRSSNRRLDMPTLIVAHSVNATTGEQELGLVRPLGSNR